jgi:Fe2+ or Zn2+ uptake regulation protein
MTISKEQIKNELLTKGIRPSHQRIRILEYLRVMENHPTADEIFEKLCGEILTLSKTTVYNTMHAFVEGNLARVIRIDGIEQRFDATLHSHGACSVTQNSCVNKWICNQRGEQLLSQRAHSKSSRRAKPMCGQDLPCSSTSMLTGAGSRCVGIQCRACVRRSSGWVDHR